MDLFVRSSGEQRTSNFLLWQSAYAEMVFLDRLWPDFDRRDLWRAIEPYADRDRRYGGAVPNETRGGAVPNPTPPLTQDLPLPLPLSGPSSLPLGNLPSYCGSGRSAGNCRQFSKELRLGQARATRNSPLADFSRDQSRNPPELAIGRLFRRPDATATNLTTLRRDRTRARLEDGDGQPGQQQQHEDPQTRPPVLATGQDRYAIQPTRSKTRASATRPTGSGASTPIAIRTTVISGRTGCGIACSRCSSGRLTSSIRDRREFVGAGVLTAGPAAAEWPASPPRPGWRPPSPPAPATGRTRSSGRTVAREPGPGRPCRCVPAAAW